MTSVFLQAAGILVREGLEALLVVAALAAYLTKAGKQARLSALYGGAGLAVLASIAAAWAFEVFYGGVHNDILEGVTILAAATLMLYVSGWLLLRQDPKAWQTYLKEKADRALEQRTVIAVALLAFLAVFREGAETVLFIHALAQTSGGWTAGMFGGLVAAAFVLAVLFVVIQTLAVRLPLRVVFIATPHRGSFRVSSFVLGIVRRLVTLPLTVMSGAAELATKNTGLPRRVVFIATSGFLFVMAVKFIGEGLQEFQEQVLVPYHEVSIPSWLSAVGLNPSVEALAAQGAVIVLAVCTYVVLHRRTRRATGITTHATNPL